MCDFSDRLLEVTGSEAMAYRERCSEFMLKVNTARLNNLAESVLAGETCIEDLDANLTTFDLFWIEDYVTAVGQGAFADRNHERLAKRIKESFLFGKSLSANWPRWQGAQLTRWVDPPKRVLRMRKLLSGSLVKAGEPHNMLIERGRERYKGDQTTFRRYA